MIAIAWLCLMLGSLAFLRRDRDRQEQAIEVEGYQAERAECEAKAW